MKIKSIFGLLKRALGPNLTQAIRPIGHGIKAYLASLFFGFPSRKLKIIAITGTKGKTSTTIFLGRLLNHLGVKAGYLSTAVINSSGEQSGEIINPYKMTSIDAVYLQKELSNMVKNGCKYAVIELSSEGLKQNRHRGLGKFAGGIFLNIYPEHLDSHGGFENYRLAKSVLFKHLAKNSFFVASGQGDQLEHSRFMYRQIPVEVAKTVKDYYVSQVRDYKIIDTKESIFKELSIDNNVIKTGFVADFELSNLVFALKAILQIDKKLYYKAVATPNMEFLGNLPGRMQWVIWDNHLVG
jgi:UDP-N-acetylmuramoyl-L-alanyl-D-glutamate--2,6-diaminopimelate ligase